MSYLDASIDYVMDGHGVGFGVTSIIRALSSATRPTITVHAMPEDSMRQI